MAESPATRIDGPRLGAGQIALEAAQPVVDAPDQVRASYRFSDPALSELRLDDLLDELLNRTREALGVDTVAILLVDEEAQQLVARAAKGIEEEVDRGVRIPIGRGFAGRIAGERVAIFIADVDHADILNPILREKGIRSLLGVPLIVEGHLIGVMHVGSLRPRMFGPERPRRPSARRGPSCPGDRAGQSGGEARARAQRLDNRSSAACCRSDWAASSGPPSRRATFPRAKRWGATGTTSSNFLGGRVGLVIGDVVGHGVPAAR